MSVDPGVSRPLVRKDEDATVKVVGLTGQLDMVDSGTRGMA
jgi:hypothetical protein